MVNSHWMSAVKGLQYLKEGLECFCSDVVNQQHERLKKLCSEACTQCDLETLIPAHSCKVEDNKRHCPLGQTNCNCLKTHKSYNAFRTCPKETCGIIYDEIIKNHGSTPPSPNWNNTDIKEWYTNPWSIATCFIKASGYDKMYDGSEQTRKGAADFDCYGLLSVMINSKAFYCCLEGNIDEDDAFSKAVAIRNKLFHSPTQKLEAETAHEYIDVMIEALGKVNYKEESRESRESRDAALDNLNGLKKMDYQWMTVEMVNSLIQNDKESKQYLLKTIEGCESSLKVERSRSTMVTEKQEETEASDADKKQRNELLNLVSRFQSVESNEDGGDNTEIRHAVIVAANSRNYQDAIKWLVVWVDLIDKGNKKVITLLATAYLDLEGQRLAESPSKIQYEMPTLSRPHDGRLITLNNEQVKGLLGNCEKRVLKGGFGVVHVSNKTVPGLDVRVVIKTIIIEGEEEKIKMLSISNEKIASRVMHFAIVPLIAYMNKRLGENRRVFYFISPFLESGNLLDAIAKDTECLRTGGDMKLKRQKRIEVLFQIASALDFLHTPVPNYRGPVLHMDLTTANIVLDNALNARIIDFGLAREMNEGQSKVSYTESKSFGTPGYYPTVRYSSLTVHEDYYNFGVVIREVLTGKPPYLKVGNDITELRKLEEGFIKKIVQGNIWTNGSGKALAELSTQCLTSRHNKLCSAKIVEKLEEMHNRQIEFTGPDETKCDTCMVNVAGVRSPHHGCRTKVCVSCMRNSHVNPIKCSICNDHVIPKIGYTFAALLIAGNDIKKEELAKSFKDDVEEIKEVLVSKCPCVVGVREENVRIVAPSDPGKPEKLLPCFNRAVNELKSSENLETLLLYFTGHHSEETGFQLGGQNDTLKLEKLQESLKKISRSWGKQTRILVFLDCCQPQSVAWPKELSNEFIKIIQVNACRPGEITEQPINGSLFQKYFIQALTRRSFNKQCHYLVGHEKPDMECEDCKMPGDFISVEQLLHYISEHMAKSWCGKQPHLYTNGITWLDAGIGYNIDFVINLELKFEGPGPTKDIQLSPKIFYDIKEVKKSILEKVIAAIDFKKQTEVKLTPVRFSDAIALRIHTGSQGGLELCSMLNVSSAVNGKREIVASYRTVSNIQNGKVVVFVPTESILLHFDSKGLVENTDEGGKLATLSWLDIDHVTNEIKDMKDLEQIRMILLKVDEKWRHGKNKESKELKVIFPCINRDKFHDFMVLDLSYKPGCPMQLYNKMANSLQERQTSLLFSVLVLIIAAILVFLMDTNVTG